MHKLIQELIAKDALFRSDFADLAKAALKELIKLKPHQLPKQKILNTIDRVAAEAIATTDGLELLLAQLAYLRKDLKRSEKWLERLIMFGMMTPTAALKRFPKLKESINKIHQRMDQEKARTKKLNEEVVRFDPGPVRLSTRNFKTWPDADELQQIFIANAAIYSIFGMARDIYFEKRKGYDYGEMAFNGNQKSRLSLSIQIHQCRRLSIFLVLRR